MKPKRPTYSDVLATGKAVQTLAACLEAIEDAQYFSPLQSDPALSIDGVTLGEALQRAFENISAYAEIVGARNKRIELEYFEVKTPRKNRHNISHIQK